MVGISHVLYVHKCIGQYVVHISEMKKKDDTGVNKGTNCQHFFFLLIRIRDCDLDVTSISVHICEVWSRLSGCVCSLVALMQTLRVMKQQMEK